MSRQHPRDLFDCKYMDISSFEDVKDGFMLCLLGSDKPIIESLQPNEIDQTDALEKQFEGMSDIAFSYEDYKQARLQLVKLVQESMTKADKDFLLSLRKAALIGVCVVPVICPNILLSNGNCSISEI